MCKSVFHRYQGRSGLREVDQGTGRHAGHEAGRAPEDGLAMNGDRGPEDTLASEAGQGCCGNLPVVAPASGRR